MAAAYTTRTTLDKKSSHPNRIPGQHLHALRVCPRRLETSFVGRLHPAGVANLAVRPATFELTTVRDPITGLDRSLTIVLS